MTRTSILAASQAALCLLAVYLVSKISLIGKVGIALFYKEYRIFRSGWKTFLLFYGIQLLIIFILDRVQRKYSARTAAIVSSAFILAGALGLLITFIDFQHTYSHRLLKERFHLGFYLFWLGWMSTGVYYLVTTFQKRSSVTAPWPVDENMPDVKE